mgnify:CR=1 FL=1
MENLNPKSTESKNPLKSEHLKEGVRPIMAGIGTRNQFMSHSGAEKIIFERADTDTSGMHNVDYYGNPEDLAEKKFKNAGKYSYVISPIDNSDKFSKSFLNCTGRVVTGQDKNTGEDISFLSHQDPAYFLRETNRNVFLSDLRQRLNELKEKGAEGTVDAVIIGGNYLPNNAEFQKHYLESIKLLSEETLKILGFEPVVMTGPKTTPGADDVFYDNKNRRLYIMRPEVGKASTESFVQSKIEEQEKKW